MRRPTTNLKRVIQPKMVVTPLDLSIRTSTNKRKTEREKRREIGKKTGKERREIGRDNFYFNDKNLNNKQMQFSRTLKQQTETKT